MTRGSDTPFFFFFIARKAPMEVRTEISRFPAARTRHEKFARRRFPCRRKSGLLDDTLVCVFSPPTPSFLSLSLPRPPRASGIVPPSRSRIFFPPSLTAPSVSSLSVSLFLFRPTDRRPFLNSPSMPFAPPILHPRPFVFSRPAISRRINCFVSFRYERRMNGTSSSCFFYYFV